MSLKHHKRDLQNCTYCPKLCRFCCPTAEAEHRETVTPWAKMTLAEMVRSDRLELTNEVGEIFYHCLACLHCRTHCRHGVDVPGALVEARRKVFESDCEPPELSVIMGRYHDAGNPWGEDLRRRLRSVVADELFVPEARVALFAGCQAIRQDPNSLPALFELLAALDIDYVAVFEGEELCCGLPLWHAGDHDGFVEQANRVAAALSAYRLVISPCPACVYTLKSLYSSLNVSLSPKVSHVLEFLSEPLTGREPERKIEGSHVYHDPCYLARYLEETSLPREILGRILAEPPAETIWSAEDAQCCGGGGLVPQLLPEVAAGATELRLKQLAASGAERVVTACPGCVNQLASAPGETAIVDIIELLKEAYCK